MVAGSATAQWMLARSGDSGALGPVRKRVSPTCGGRDRRGNHDREGDPWNGDDTESSEEETAEYPSGRDTEIEDGHEDRLNAVRVGCANAGRDEQCGGTAEPE